MHSTAQNGQSAFIPRPYDVAHRQGCQITTSSDTNLTTSFVLSANGDLSYAPPVLVCHCPSGN